MAGALPSGPIEQTPHATWISVSRPDDRVAAAIARAVGVGEARGPVADFYRSRQDRPLWVRDGQLGSEGAALIGIIEGAASEGLDPAPYDAAEIRRAIQATSSGRPADLARAELTLSRAYADYVADLHRAPASADLAFRDPALPGPTDERAALEALASAPDLKEGMASAQRMHPIYRALRAELNTRSAGDPLRPLILANMARARALPGAPGSRYVLVDVAAQRLTLFEDGEPQDEMRVIVGMREAQTPAMAGLIRYAKFHPYWNVPPDIVRDEIAPQVIREGVSYLRRQEMEILSDWSAAARPVPPDEVNWSAVASGATTLRMRRSPGAHNILGDVKLMLPNPLGIYLHDTPNKGQFLRANRTLSHGCIRLEDAHRLTRRLFGPVADSPPAGDDARVDLPRPIPVYVVYFTLAPSPGGLERRPDIYRRDPPLMAELSGGPAPS